MNQRKVRDLFGKSIRVRRPLYEVALERRDKASLPERAERVRWIARTLPKNLLIGLPTETFIVFNELKSTYTNGQFVATIVLATSFVEHWFVANLEKAGFTDKHTKTLSVCIKTLRENNLVPSVVLNKAEKLNNIRRPFVHLKSFEYEHNLGSRACRLGKHPLAVLEDDAKEALILVYAVLEFTFK